VKNKPSAVLILVGLSLLLVTSLSAQTAPSGPTLRPFGSLSSSPSAVTQACKPCLFYAGDFDQDNSAANGLFDGNTLSGDGEVYIPFRVPRRQKWHVLGLMLNVLASVNVMYPQQAYWEIRSGVRSGNGGALLASGTNPATLLFGNCQFGLCPDTVVVSGIHLQLSHGEYWLMVQPPCTSSNDCQGALYYAEDVEDIPPPHHVGPLEPWDASFFSSTTFNYSFAPTWGPNGACNGLGCDRFSAGVLGKYVRR
jgi:hypothetical protein